MGFLGTLVKGAAIIGVGAVAGPFVGAAAAIAGTAAGIAGAAASAGAVKDALAAAEMEGKKQGYEQAAHEYDRAYRELNAEYERLTKAIEADKSANNAKANELIGKLDSLEQKRRELERRFNDKAQDVARKWDMPVSDVKKGLIGGSIGSDNPFLAIIGMWSDSKKRKAAEGRAKGYAEARELFEQKIRSLKAKLNELKAGAADSMKMFIGEIAKLVDAITLEEHKIAQLQSML